MSNHSDDAPNQVAFAAVQGANIATGAAVAAGVAGSVATAAFVAMSGAAFGLVLFGLVRALTSDASTPDDDGYDGCGGCG